MQYIGDELPKRGEGLGQFANLRGEFTKKRIWWGDVFDGGGWGALTLTPDTDTIILIIII